MERRRYPRFETGIFVKYHRLAENKFIDCCAKDINYKGLRLVIEEDLSLGDFVQLHLCLPGRPHLEILGKVVWEKQFKPGCKEAGIVFVNLPDHFKDEIFEYIYKYHRQEFIKHWWEGVK